MPAPYARRDPIQALARAVNRNSPGQAQGRFRGLSPAAASMTQPSRTDPTIAGGLELHHIEGWSIADDSDDTFALDFEPLLNSWNLSLNGARVHRSEFTISGHVLTIANPTDLFLGADSQGTPWDLEIQYDYLVPGVPGPATFDNSAFASGNDAAPTITVPAVQVGSVMLLAIIARDTNEPSSPSGWTQVGTALSLYVRTGVEARFSLFKRVCDGTETTAIASLSAGSRWAMTLGAYVGTDGTVVTDFSTSVSAPTGWPADGVTGPLVVQFVGMRNDSAIANSGDAFTMDPALTEIEHVHGDRVGIRFGHVAGGAATFTSTPSINDNAFGSFAVVLSEA